jgi:hypothetical protein
MKSDEVRDGGVGRVLLLIVATLMLVGGCIGFVLRGN